LSAITLHAYDMQIFFFLVFFVFSANGLVQRLA